MQLLKWSARLGFKGYYKEFFKSKEGMRGQFRVPILKGVFQPPPSIYTSTSVKLPDQHNTYCYTYAIDTNTP